MTDESLLPVFIPPLVAILLAAERKKGTPLIEDEVLAIRDGGVCMMMRQSIAVQMAEKRGYDDINPESVWEDWQRVRESLQSD